VKGRRRPDRFSDKPDFKWEKVKPGDYFKERGGGWFVMAPTGEQGSVRSPNWTITEHEDRTITVSPSIWFNKERNGYHGFLERGTWRPA
jgi:hypothetical protein